MERVVIVCNVQDDYTGSDDVRVSLDGHEIGRVSIKSRAVLEGTATDHIEGPWEVQAGSRIVIEELDLTDSNDLLWDHTFTDDDFARGTVTGGTWAHGMYDFGVHFKYEPAQ